MTLHEEFEKNVETLVGLLEAGISTINKWFEDVDMKTNPHYIPQKATNIVISMLESFHPFADLFPKIKRFLTCHIPNFTDKVESRHSDINKTIEDIVAKCSHNPCNPPTPPKIPYAEMSELRRYIELLVEDLHYCVKEAREESAKTAGTNAAQQVPTTKKDTSGGKAGDAKESRGQADFANTPISKLIKQGESHTLEFKETFEYDTQQNQKSSDVLFSSLKTIAGFLNAMGGTLLIGVDDSGKIRGIDQYLNTMRRGNNDTFEQQIRNCLINRFEPQPIGKVNISFEKFMEGTICRVDVQVSKEPVNLDNKVYVREGNTTQPLKGRPLIDWIKQRNEASKSQ